MVPKQTISDLVLEQYVLGELSASLEKRVREALGSDASLRARLAVITQSDAEILSDYPPERVVPAIRERFLADGRSARRPARRAPTLAWALPAAAMVAVILAFFVVRERAAITEDQTRLKGMTAHMSLFRKTTRGAEELRGGALARKGDVLQVAYSAAEERFGVILSVDGRGTVTWHVPSGYRGGPLTAPALDQKGQVVLPAAYELDDAPGFERFFFVFAPAPFDVAGVERAARALAAQPSRARSDPLDLAAGLGQYSFLVKKQG
jgi:hypothetical protein